MTKSQGWLVIAILATLASRDTTYYLSVSWLIFAVIGFLAAFLRMGGK
jgi:hypothetical protein